MNEMIPARKPVKVEVTRNPLRFDEREEYISPYLPGTLNRYIPADVTVDEHTIIRQNGHVIARERWGSRPVGAGDHIEILAVPGGLGAIIASALSASFATTSAAGVTTLTALGIGTAIAIDLTLSIGLSYLSSLLVDQPKLPEMPESPTYGAGGVKTTQTNGAIIPIHYGKGRLGGNIIRSTTGHIGGESSRRANYTRVVGGFRTNVTLGLCEGPVYSIGGITSDRSQLWFTSQGEERVVYNTLNTGPVGGYTLRPASGGEKLAWYFYITDQPAYISDIRINMRRSGTITAGKKVSITFQGNTEPDWIPDGTAFNSPIEVEASTIPTAYSDISFTPPGGTLTLGPSASPFWLVIEGDFDVSDTNNIAVSYGSATPTTGVLKVCNAGTWLPYGRAVATMNKKPIARIKCSPTKYYGGSGGIKINGSPVEAFAANGYVSTRLGTKHQEAIPGSSNLTLEQAVDESLPYDRELIHTTQGAVDSFGIVIFFPGGWYRTESHGRQADAAFVAECQWRVTGETEWQGSFVASETFLALAPTGLAWRVDLPTVPSTNNPVTRGNQLDIAIKRIVPAVGQGGAPDIVWKSIRLYNDDQAQSYPHIALLQTDIDVGTSQGSIENITTLTEGKIVKVYDPDVDWSDQYSTNPAWCAMDLYLNRRYGGGRWYTLNNVDLTAWAEWADNNDLMIKDGQGGLMKRWELGYTVDQPRPLRDHLAQIAACSRTKLVDYGNKLVPVPDVASDSVMIFNTANVGVGSFRIQFIGKAKRPNKVSVRFYNEDLDYAEDYATVADPSIHVTGTPEIEEVVDRTGITRPARARREARYLLNQAKRIGWICEYDGFIGAVGCEPGQVVDLASDLWESVGGRLNEDAAAGLNSIVLDRDITIDTSGDVWEISVDDGTMSDAIQTREILEGPGTYSAGDTVDITPSWTDKPLEGWHWSAGPVRTQVNRGTRKAKIVSMEISQDFRVHLKAVQYDARVYDDYPGLEDPVPVVPARSNLTIPPRVKDLALHFEYYGEAGKPRVTATWSKAVWPYAYTCKVWARIIGPEYNDRFQAIWEPTPNSNFVFPDVLEGLLYEVSVTPVAPGSGQHVNPASSEAARKYIYVQRPMDPMRMARISSAVF